MTKIIFVCQAPGRTSSEPLDGAAGRRLAALAGLDLPKLLARFERVNLLPPQPKDGKGNAFDLHAARARADKLREGWAGRKAVLLGRGVAAAFRLVPDDYQWFKPIELPPGFEAAVMPHPSGISTWWNDDSNVEAARQFMQRLNVGFLTRIERKIKKSPEVGGRPERFSFDQVSAALIAGDGMVKQTAMILAEETGIPCSRQILYDYFERYPALQDLRERCKQNIGDVAEGNVWRAVRDGNPDISLKLLRCKMFAGRGYELMVEGRMQHSGTVGHVHVTAELAQLGLKLDDKELTVLEGVYKRLDDAPGTAEGSQSRLPAPPPG